MPKFILDILVYTRQVVKTRRQPNYIGNNEMENIIKASSTGIVKIHIQKRCRKKNQLLIEME